LFGLLNATHLASSEEQLSVESNSFDMENIQAAEEGWIPGDFVNHLHGFRS
jgi:hypothetical protein